MIKLIWINGAFGSGKTQTAYELNARISDSFVYDPENMGYFIYSQNYQKFWGYIFTGLRL